MNPSQAGLYRRIREFRFDAPGTSYTFARRLAKENGWPPTYADRVIEEYRRFAFLAAAAGHPVSPSDAVDQAWHLHLVYTRSYWDEFCGTVLGKPLHHEPSRGGGAERTKFDGWYARTLQGYRRFFAEDPPADIWPQPGAKASQAEHRRVDVASHWVLPKPHAGAAVAAVMSVLLAALLPGGCGAGEAPRSSDTSFHLADATFNPFDLRGPPFLAFYVIAFAGGCVAAWMVRSAVRGPNEPPPRGLRLDPYQIAYLNGGPVHAVNAAVASLFHRDIIKVDQNDATVKVTLPCNRLPHPLEQAVHDAAWVNGTSSVHLKDVRTAVRPAVERIGEGLKREGLLVPDDAARNASVRATLVAVAVPAVGAVKVAVGLSRDKPVGFLILLCIVSAAVALAAFARRPHRTRRGDAVILGLKSANARLRTNVAGVGPEAVLLGVAVFGLDFLGATNVSFLDKTLRPKNGSFSNSGCGGGGTSCGSSCGGGGCGGGCGGCGGCGGD